MKTFKKDGGTIRGQVVAILRDSSGSVKSRTIVSNLITSVGDQFYASRVTGTPDSQVTGMKLGTSSTAPSKTGAGAALGSYLTGSQQALDSAPTAVGGVVTFIASWGAGEATSASPITEAVLVNDVLADSTSSEGNTIARVLLAGIPAKGAEDTLTLTWTHTLVGA